MGNSDRIGFTSSSLFLLFSSLGLYRRYKKNKGHRSEIWTNHSRRVQDDNREMKKRRRECASSFVYHTSVVRLLFNQIAQIRPVIVSGCRNSVKGVRANGFQVFRQHDIFQRLTVGKGIIADGFHRIGDHNLLQGNT